MSSDGKDPVFRHPDAAAYLKGLSGEEASVHPPLVRRHGDGFVQYWIEGGEVRCREAGSGPSVLQSLLDSVRGNFGGLLPRLEREAGGPAPDLDSIERALRDGAHESGAAALKAVLEAVDARLPAPECDSCGRPMARQRTAGKVFLTRLGAVEIRRGCYRCRRCGRGHHPLDRALGIEGESFTPGAASIMADAVCDDGHEAASRKLGNLAGVSIPSGTLQRHVESIAGQVRRFDLEVVESGPPPSERVCVAIDGTGVPVRRAEVKGVRGKGDGEAGTREAKVLAVYTADGRNPETGDPERDRGSEVYSARIDSAAARSGAGETSDFARRLAREADRTGLREAGEVVAVSDGAAWIRNVCEEVLSGQTVVFVLDWWHAMECAAGALKVLFPDEGERRERMEAVKSTLRDGGVASVIDMLRPFRDRGEAVAKCIDCFESNRERMRCDEYRKRGIQVGSGIVESACRHLVGLRFKRPGSRWDRGRRQRPDGHQDLPEEQPVG